MVLLIGGAMAQRREDSTRKSVHGKDGGHYNTFSCKPGEEMRLLKDIFPNGQANELSFVLFSTSGVHGTYSTIEAQWDQRDERQKEIDEDEYLELDEKYQHSPEVTFLIIQPRLCTTTHGNVKITCQEDADYLKKLRQTSWEVVKEIGK